MPLVYTRLHVLLFLLDDIAKHALSIEPKDHYWAILEVYAVFVKDKSNADPLVVQEQKSKSVCILIMALPTGRIHDGLAQGSGQGQANSAFPYACGVCNLSANY
jgi:hypothetical protein